MTDQQPIESRINDDPTDPSYYKKIIGDLKEVLDRAKDDKARADEISRLSTNAVLEMKESVSRLEEQLTYLTGMADNYQTVFDRDKVQKTELERERSKLYASEEERKKLQAALTESEKRYGQKDSEYFELQRRLDLSEEESKRSAGRISSLESALSGRDNQIEALRSDFAKKEEVYLTQQQSLNVELDNERTRYAHLQAEYDLLIKKFEDIGLAISSQARSYSKKGGKQEKPAEEEKRE